MIESNFESWEKRVREMAAGMDYPPTPDIAAGVRRRLVAGKWLSGGKRRPVAQPWYSNRLAWAVAAVLLVAALLLAVPQARAAILNFFQIGVIRIFPAEPTVTPVFEGAVITPVPTAEPQTLPGFSIADLVGEATLADLEAELGDALLLPEYPAGVGLPDQVYLQDQIGMLGILVWLEADSTDKAWAVLHILALDQGAFGAKFHVESLRGTEVNGRPAYWVEGLHLLSFYDAEGQINSQITRLVEGNTLIWTVDDDITYRLETVLTLEEAVRMAESME